MADQNMPDISHLSARAQERLKEEMQSGKDRLKNHRKAVEAADRAMAARGVTATGDSVTADGRDIVKTAEQLVAERAAADKRREADAADAQAAAARANALKETQDHAENIGLVPAVSNAVKDEAEELVTARVEQAGDVSSEHTPGEGQEEASQANAEKEVQDRVEASNTQGDTVFPGPAGAIDTGPRYDDNGEEIVNSDPAHVDPATAGQANVDRQPTAADLISVDQPETTGRGRRRAVPTPAAAVGSGPKSE